MFIANDWKILVTYSRLLAVDRVWVEPATTWLRVRYSTNWTSAPTTKINQKDAVTYRRNENIVRNVCVSCVGTKMSNAKCFVCCVELYFNFSSSPSATTSHYIVCSESVLCSCSYSLELSWCPHPFSWYVFWHLRTGLKLNCLNLATHNCFWRHRSARDSLAIWHVGRVRNLFVCMYMFMFM